MPGHPVEDPVEDLIRLARPEPPTCQLELSARQQDSTAIRRFGQDLAVLGARTVRDYDDTDEESWLTCRTLAFLHTDYFDDVLTEKPRYDGDSIELVAVAPDGVMGVLDVVLEGELATIETVAVHPGAARRGVARTLLQEALTRMPPLARTLDAWTREDVAANAWYVANDFHETFRYLHVYASGESELSSAIPRTRRGLRPITAFFHADSIDEEPLRHEFERVYICRRYELPLIGG